MLHICNKRTFGYVFFVLFVLFRFVFCLFILLFNCLKLFSYPVFQLFKTLIYWMWMTDVFCLFVCVCFVYLFVLFRCLFVFILFVVVFFFVFVCLRKTDLLLLTVYHCYFHDITGYNSNGYPLKRPSILLLVLITKKRAQFFLYLNND